MTVRIFTIVLDGQPWITHHLPIFNRLTVPWTWTIAHGVSKNVRDTRWIRAQAPRLSNDGTTEYLASIRSHPRVRVFNSPEWHGKIEMVNACLDGIQEGDVLLEVDVDELWTAEQIETIAKVFAGHPGVDAMQFWCRYFLGPNIVIGPRDGNSYGCRQTEWTRAWRIKSPAQRFLTHEPPVMPEVRHLMLRDETLGYGLEFDHYAYATKAQLAYKQEVYGYPGAVEGWDRLQANKEWPVKRLKLFLPWVDEKSTADLWVK